MAPHKTEPMPNTTITGAITGRAGVTNAGKKKPTPFTIPVKAILIVPPPRTSRSSFSQFYLSFEYPSRLDPLRLLYL